MKVTRGNRLHIGFYGKRNVGKSTLFNLILGADYAITSEILGTTTDVNLKSMELLPVGPVTLMDCAGIDDTEALGVKRVQKTLKSLEKADVAVFVCDYSGIDNCDKDFLKNLSKRKIPFLVLINKSDVGCISTSALAEIKAITPNIIETSMQDKELINKFKTTLAKILPKNIEESFLPPGINTGDTAVLVIPIDKEAPKGRIILPQVQVLRNLLDKSCISVVCKESELGQALSTLREPPKIVITDSQAFKVVSKIVPENIPLTSFSIIFANIKGDLYTFYEGAKKIDSLRDGDKVLIAESCTHHAIEDDIGRVKIPNLIKKYTGKNITFEIFAGCDFPKNIKDYALIIHCGACMTNRAEVLSRIEIARVAGVGITNYGIAIAKCLGILERAITPFRG